MQPIVTQELLTQFLPIDLVVHNFFGDYTIPKGTPCLISQYLDNSLVVYIPFEVAVVYHPLGNDFLLLADYKEPIAIVVESTCFDLSSNTSPTFGKRIFNPQYKLLFPHMIS